MGHLGQGAGTPFAAAIKERYQRGVGWLFAVDAPPVIKEAAGDDAPPIEFAGMVGMRYLFVEQRAPAGAEENEVTVAFDGARTGMGSWLADSGSGGAAEYLPADALAAGYVSTREPLQVFEELSARLSASAPDFQRVMATADEKLGTGFIQNLTAALGTESALALTGFSIAGPTWVMTTVANDPMVIDSSLQKLVDAFNAELTAEEQSKRIVLESGERGRTDVERAEARWPADQRGLDLRSAATWWRRRIAAWPSARSRRGTAARRSSGRRSSSASCPPLPAFIRRRSAG